MSIDENIRLLMQSLGEQVLDGTETNIDRAEVQQTLSILIDETKKFRTKLLEDRGVTFTVEDTQKTLLALDRFMDSKEVDPELTLEQHALLQIWIDRLTLFGND